MSKKDDTLFTAEAVFEPAQLANPELVHLEVVANLHGKLALALKYKIISMFPVGERSVCARYPAYKNGDFLCDNTTFGVELHIMSKMELQAAIDAETKALKIEHIEILETIRQQYRAQVMAEAKRLLEKASL